MNQRNLKDSENVIIYKSSIDCFYQVFIQHVFYWTDSGISNNNISHLFFNIKTSDYIWLPLLGSTEGRCLQLTRARKISWLSKENSS